LAATVNGMWWLHQLWLLTLLAANVNGMWWLHQLWLLM